MRFREWYSFNKPFMKSQSKMGVVIIRSGSESRMRWDTIIETESIDIKDAIDLYGDLIMYRFETSGSPSRISVILIKDNPNQDQD